MPRKDKSLLEQENHFAFGRNWLDYAEKVDDGLVEQAVTDLQRLLGGRSLENKTFLDIGCGSGIHSLAALRLGAGRVVGIDIDPDSVEAASRTLAKFRPDANASFRVVSIFDADLKVLGQFEVVYSWGVLHHTGDMYAAIEKASAFVAPGGEFQIALYKKTPFCGMWKVLKRRYSNASEESQRRARYVYVLMRRAAHRMRGRSLDAYIKDYHQNRGMNFYNDVHDWLGGYPYESISPDECVRFFAGLGMALERKFIQPRGRYLPGLLGSGCDEYVFRRSESR